MNCGPTSIVEEPKPAFIEKCTPTALSEATINKCATSDCNDGLRANGEQIFIKQEVAESDSDDNINVSNVVNTVIKKETNEINVGGTLNSKPEDDHIKNEVIFLPAADYIDEDCKSSNKLKSKSHTEDCVNYNDKHDNPSKSALQNSKQKIISCTKCNYVCTRKVDLTDHLQTHLGEKPFCCAYCDYKGARKSDLLRHSRTHTGEKPFTCTFCDYKSSQKANLNKHLRYHTGEKPFSCIECDYKCFQKNQLIDHQIIHTGEKPLNCSLCDYKCIRKGDLTSHMRTHTGEKQFSCINCNYKCYRKTNLIRHMRVHSKLVYSCTFCNFECLKQTTFVTHLTKHTERNHRKGIDNNCDDKVEEVLRRFITQNTHNYEQEPVETVKIEEPNTREESF